MLKPKNTQEVSDILKYCNDRNLAVVPQGGNTGLVGGSQPVFDEIILNMSRMNKILEFDESYGIVTSEAGTILQDLHDYLKPKGYLMPLDLGAKGSCQIGGNLATNAGGIHFIKYNSLHANCVGLEVVLPNGKILDNITNLRKDNTGYDMKHLFIGAEGTLGVITKSAILCPTLPKNKQLCLVSCKSFHDVLELLKKAKLKLSDILQAAEFMDCISMSTVNSQLGFKNPMNKEYPFYVLIEVYINMFQVASNSEDGKSDAERLFNLLGESENIIIDGVVAQDEKQSQHIWKIREEIHIQLKLSLFKVYRLLQLSLNMDIQLISQTLKYDLSLGTNHYYKIVDDVKNEIMNSTKFNAQEKEIIRVTGYGHIGDGNLHLNISVPGYDHKDLQDRLSDAVDPFVFEYIKKCGGSVSAEHGIGLQKAKYLSYSKTPEMILYMNKIKGLFDPNGIMNPYKVLID